MSNINIQQGAPQDQENTIKQNQIKSNSNVQNPNNGKSQMCQKQKQQDQNKKDSEGEVENQKNEAEEPENQVQEYLQVRNTRIQGQMMGKKEQFLKIFQQINKEKEYLREQAKMLQKKRSMKKRTSEVKDPKSGNVQMKKDQILKKIQPYVQKYKAMHSPNFSDSQVTKLRFEGKQKVFKYILYFAEELKSIPEDNLNQMEKKIKAMQKQQLVKIARTISLEIDVQFLNQLNAGNKQTASKRYRSHWRNLTGNIHDDTNIDLRRKIATKQWDAKKITNLPEMDFYSPQKRQIILQKNKRLMNQATIQQKNVVVQQEQNIITYEQKSSWGKNQVEQKKPVYRYIDQGSLFMIRDLISNQQIAKMKNFLQDGLKEATKEKLVGSLTRVFQNKGITQ